MKTWEEDEDTNTSDSTDSSTHSDPNEYVITSNDNGEDNRDYETEIQKDDGN